MPLTQVITPYAAALAALAALAGLSLAEGAYMAEIIRGGLLAVDQGQRHLVGRDFADRVLFEVPNPRASAEMRYKCVDLDNIQIQLCQPSPADSPQRRFLGARGEGVYHLGFEVADCAAAEAAGRARGLDVTARGRRADGTGFVYFDTRNQAGVVLEVRKSA